MYKSFLFAGLLGLASVASVLSAGELTLSAGSDQSSGTAPLAVQFNAQAAGGVTAAPIDFNAVNVQAYAAGQFGDGQGSTPTSHNIVNSGRGIALSGNAWKKIAINYTITANTVIAFDFSSTNIGEIHGILFDTNDRIDNDQGDPSRAFQIAGSQNWGLTQYSYGGSGTQHFQIPVGDFYTGTFSHLVFINDEDVANPTANGTYSNVRIYESNAAPNYSYQWNFKDGATSTQQNPTHTFNSAGTYAVTVAATDGFSTVTQTISVEVTPSVDPLTVNVSANPQSGAAPLDVQFQATATGGGALAVNLNDYTLQPHAADQFGDGQNNTPTNATVVNGGAGIRLDGNAWKKLAQSYTFTQNTVVEFDFQSTRQGEIQGIMFDNDNLIEGDNGLGLQVYGTQNWGIRNYAYNGSGTQHFKIRTGTHFTGSYSHIVFINDHDAAPNDAQCVISNLRIYEDPVSYTYQWNFGDGSTSTAAAPQHTFQNPGQYDVTVTVGDGLATITKTIRVDVQSQGGALTASIIANPTSGTVPLEVQFIGSAATDEKPFTNFSAESILPHAAAQFGDGQGNTPTAHEIVDDGATVKLTGNAWKKIAGNYAITSNTVLEFDFSSSRQGEIHGIYFDNDDVIDNSDQTNAVRVYGTQNWSTNVYPYSGSGTQHFVIPIGTLFTGSFSHMIFANDHDVANANAEGCFSNVRLYEQDSSSSLSYAWVFGDGSSSNAKNPKHTYTSGEFQNVTLTVSDGSDSAQATTVIYVNIAPIADAGQNVVSATVGDTIGLDGSGSHDPNNGPQVPMTFKWLQTAGPSVSLDTTVPSQPTLVPTAAGDYTFSLTAFDGMAWSAPSSVNVQVIDSEPPTIELTSIVFKGSVNGTGSAVAGVTVDDLSDSAPAADATLSGDEPDRQWESPVQNMQGSTSKTFDIIAKDAANNTSKITATVSVSDE